MGGLRQRKSWLWRSEMRDRTLPPINRRMLGEDVIVEVTQQDTAPTVYTRLKGQLAFGGHGVLCGQLPSVNGKA